MKTQLLPISPFKKYNQEYIGIVEDTDDPKKLMRVRVRVKEIFTDNVPTEDLPWATYKLPVGARVNDGFFTPVDVGDYVWVDFPCGDTRRPRITGSVHYAPDEVPNFPHESFSGDDCLDHKRAGNEPAPGATGYHRDCVYTQHGMTVEIGEDTSIRVTHRETGSALEMTSKGHFTIHGEASVYISAQKDEEIIVEGDHSQRVMGDSKKNVMGTHIMTGAKEVKITSDAKVTIKAPMVNIN